MQANVDIPPGGWEPLDVVMRQSDLDECWGWHNWLIVTWCKPPDERKFVLPRGRFYALVHVRSTSTESRRLFEIVNDVPIEHFRLGDRGEPKGELAQP